MPVVPPCLGGPHARHRGGLLVRPGWAVCSACVPGPIRERGPRAWLASLEGGRDEGPSGLAAALRDHG
eukprot:4874240-Alexandrium_andersonii.AAC.1